MWWPYYNPYAYYSWYQPYYYGLGWGGYWWP